MFKAVLSKAIISLLIMANTPAVIPGHIDVSRGETLHIERRVMTVTAYTNHDPGMDGKGITTSGEKTIEGRTIAAPEDIPLGSKIYIPALDHTYTVTDRGGAIKGNRLDLYMEKRSEALEFGDPELEVRIKKWEEHVCERF